MWRWAVDGEISISIVRMIHGSGALQLRLPSGRIQICIKRQAPRWVSEVGIEGAGDASHVVCPHCFLASLDDEPIMDIDIVVNENQDVGTADAIDG